jgi:hypothetical protein
MPIKVPVVCGQCCKEMREREGKQVEDEDPVPPNPPAALINDGEDEDGQEKIFEKGLQNLYNFKKPNPDAN